MIILNSPDDLIHFLNQNDCRQGCLADTGFLYGWSFDDDRVHQKAHQVYDIVSNQKIGLYSNVISRWSSLI